jgi:hypothetical protein
MCATLAWSGWVFLKTAGDDQRVQQVVADVLSDPSARSELAGLATEGFTSSVNKAAGTELVDAKDPDVRAAIDRALSDPSTMAVMITAVANMHANALGADPPRETTVDPNVFIGAVVKQLSQKHPEIADQLAGVHGEPVSLGSFKVPFAGPTRDLARVFVPVLAACALAGITGSLFAGPQSRVLRRIGLWAMVTSLLWVAGPKIAVWAIERWSPEQQALGSVAVKSAAATVTGTATVLGIVGGAVYAAGVLISVLDSRADKEAQVHLDPGAGRSRT